MALLNTTAFDVRTTGADTNGGGYNTAAGTTDYSQQDSPQIALTDAVAVGTTTITSVSGLFTAAMVGNCAYMTGGTGPLASQIYQITAFTNTTTVTVDRNIAAGTGITMNIGGAMATIQTAINAAWITAASRVADCWIYVKKGAYANTVALTISGSLSATAKNRFRLIGYNTAHGDNPSITSGNQPTYAVGSGAGVNGFDAPTSPGLEICYMTFDGTLTTGTKGVIGINNSGNGFRVVECKIMNFSSSGFLNVSTSNCAILNSEITGCNTSAGNGAVDTNVFTLVAYCWIHKNTKTGIFSNAGSGLFVGNLITNNGNAGAGDGISTAGTTNIIGNTVYGCARHGINCNNNAGDVCTGNVWFNNIIAKCVSNGITAIAGQVISTVYPNVDYNAFYSNGANYSNITAGAHDVSVAVNPFTSTDVDLAAETAPNWGLNSTA